MFSALYASPRTASWLEPTEALKQQLQQSSKLLQNYRLRRARSYYLYFYPTQTTHKKDGKVSRLCDLYLDAGQALRGYRPVNTRLKNAMSRGLFTALPVANTTQNIGKNIRNTTTRCEADSKTPNNGGQRLTKLLSRLFPGVQDFRIYQSLHTLEMSGFLPGFCTSQLLCCRESAGIQLWRPLASNRQNTKFLLPVLAFSGLPLPYLVLSFGSPALPPSELCSPLQIETLAIALGQTESLLASEQRYSSTSQKKTEIWGYRNANSSLERLRCRVSQKLGWEMDGIYLYFRTNFSEDKDLASCFAEYSQLWQKLLAHGFLLPPNPWAPILLPPTLLRADMRLSNDGQRLLKLLEV